MRPRLLVADDQPDVLSALRLLLGKEGIDVVSHSSPAGALAAAAAERFDAALIDLNYARDTTYGAEGGRSDGVSLAAQRCGEALVLEIFDQGPGTSSTANLFVPFFTTKPGGSGVGLALSRQIAEVHGGTLALENRSDARGAVATLMIAAAARISAAVELQ